MRTPASIRDHPLHPMLVPIPIGLWIFSLGCDLLGRSNEHQDLWFVLALYTMIGGVLGALVAALPGFVDYYARVRRSAHARLATAHMALNLLLVVLYAVNVVLRIAHPTQTTVPLVLSLVGVAMLGCSGWLGGSLVHVHGVGVARASEDDAATGRDPSPPASSAEEARR